MSVSYQKTQAVSPIPDDPNVLANELAKAVSEGQLSLHYQPIINFEKGHVEGFEALMRWNHSAYGNIPPSVFIPVAEESGLIVEASRWALREACRALSRIETKVRSKHVLYMSVNFSASDFAEENFLDQIYTILSETDLHPGKLCLEISEKLLIAQPEKSKESLSMCRKAGLGITLDDFNVERLLNNGLSGYPVNAVKIDRSFISSMLTDEAARAAVETIVHYGQTSNVKIIAEGVERQEEMDFLKAAGCTHAQGYFFFKPYSEIETTEKIRDWSSARK